MHHLIVGAQPQHAAFAGCELESQNSQSFIKTAPGAVASTHQDNPGFWRQAGVILQGECSQMVAGGACGHQLSKRLTNAGEQSKTSRIVVCLGSLHSTLYCKTESAGNSETG